MDRWRHGINSQGTWTLTQEQDAPTGSGFRNSLKMLCTTADASPAAGDFLFVSQRIEGQNLQAIRKGTANAQQLTLSFWVKSNVTGTYTLEIRDLDNARSVSAAYTVASSGTWEKKTAIIPADTTGVLDNDNAGSFTVYWNLGQGTNFTSGTLNTTWGSRTLANIAVGQTNLAAATDNYWQITGVQLEVGAVATPFEFKPLAQELQECERYFQICAFMGVAIGTGEMGIASQFKTRMRAGPSMSSILRSNDEYTGTNNQLVRVGTGPVTVTSASFNTSSSGNNIGNILTTGLVSGAVYIGSFQASAEL
jgi:hypothetical protein